MDAVEHAFEAGQQLVVDRVELLRLDARAAARRLGGSLALLAAGLVAVGLGWCALLAAFALWEGGPIDTVWGRLAAIGAAHLLAGGAIIAAGIRSERRSAGRGKPDADASREGGYARDPLAGARPDDGSPSPGS